MGKLKWGKKRKEKEGELKRKLRVVEGAKEGEGRDQEGWTPTLGF